MTATPEKYTRLPEELLFRREVAAWMEALVDKDGEYTDAPKTRDDVYRNVVELWTEKGFLDANELKRELALKYMKDAPPQLRDVIKAVHTHGEKRDIDELSGGLRKTHLDTITGLAQLYAIEMDRPVALFELDYSNMGGTNLFFKKLIAKAKNVPLEEVDDEEAELLTDRCAKIIANTIRSTINRITGMDNEICIRAGGDELRFIVPDLDLEQYPSLKDDIHDSIQEITAIMGLHDHAYLKEPNNKYKQGFGAAIDNMDMRNIKDKAQDLKSMDNEIRFSKVEMGYERLGEINEEAVHEAFLEMVRSDVEGRERSGQTIPQLTNTMLEMERERVKSRHLYFEVLKAGKGADVAPKERLDAILKEIDRYETMDRFYLASHQSIVETEHNSLQNKLDAGGEWRKLYESLEERLKNSVDSYLKTNGVELVSYQRQVLDNTLSILAPIDPVTKTWLDRDMPATAEIYMRDARKHTENIMSVLGQAKYPMVKRSMENYAVNSSELDTMKPQGMRFAFHNLAGLNKLLGQNGANAVLEGWAQDVIKQALFDSGLEESNHYRIAHYGGGEFQVIMPPIVGIRDWGLMPVNEEALESIASKVCEKTKQINQANIKQYLENKGVIIEDIPENMTFSQVKDAKQDRHGWGDGIYVSVVKGALEASEHSTKTPGGSALYAQKKQMEMQVDMDRQAKQALWQWTNNQQNNGGQPWAKQEIS